MDAEKLKQWIWESLLLDLAHDEENKTLADEAANGEPLSLNRMRWERPPTFAEFLRKRSIPEYLRTPDNPDAHFFYFKVLKWSRVKISLELNRAAKAYAGKRDDQKKYWNLLNASQKRNEFLNIIALHCLGGMNSASSALASAKPGQMDAWKTLLGLFHSEACAVAKQETSCGLAASYSDFVPEGTTGSKIFEWIAGHNKARGFNHMSKQLDASKILDTRVDLFPKKDIQELSAELPSNKNLSERADKLYRLLYFPAVLTLAQALEDLGRHAECRYYLREGITKARELNSLYWIEYFKMKIAFSALDTKRTRSNSENCSLREVKPGKLMPRQTQLQYQLCCGCEIVECKYWPESVIWLLCWHACETYQLYERIRRTCEECTRVLKGVSKSGSKQNEDKDRIDNISSAFMEHFRLLQSWAGNGSKGLSYLLGNDGSGVLLNPAPPAIWPPAKALYETLKGLPKYILRDELGKWKHDLWKLLEPEEVFSLYRSRNEWFETIRPSLIGKAACPANLEEAKESHKHCGSHGCAYRLLHLQEEGDDDGKPNYGSLDYFFSVMAAQQERFKLYLEHRTAKKKYFRLGEAEIPVPDFELIALRRWNSFSPNLGSRGSVTVGGGYLVRVYDPSADRYLGVAVDPGYNFLENLFNEGFTIPDIDLVVVTHAHPDHTENLTNLITLLRERRKRLQGSSTPDQNSGSSSKDSSILLAVTEGVFERFQLHFKGEGDFLRDIAVLHAKGCRGNRAGENALWLSIENVDTDLCHMDLGKAPAWDRDGQSRIRIEAKQALHGDGTSHDSIGIVLTLEKQTEEPIHLGILSDTRYHTQLSTDYAECKVIVAHIGSLLDEAWYEDYNRRPEVQKDVRNFLDASPADGDKPEIHSRSQLDSLLTKKNHLYLPGLARFLCELDKEPPQHERLILLSEFGEELRGGLRKLVTGRLSKISEGRAMGFMPVDVGLRVDASNGTIFCSVCHRFMEPNKIEPYSVLPSEEAMAYVCLDCRFSRSGEIDRLVEEWCHTGRPVVPLMRR